MVEGQADGLESPDGPPPCGFEGGSDVGVEFGAPFGPEAVCNFAKGDTRPDRLLGAVVGGRDGAVLHEDEQVLSALLHDGPEFFSLVMAGLDPQERIEIGVEFARVAAQCAVGEI